MSDPWPGGPARQARLPAAATAFRQELQGSNRLAGLIGGFVMLTAFPAWSLYDHVAVPRLAPAFLVVRLATFLPVTLIVLALCAPRLGRRYSTHLTFTLMLLPLLVVAWMLPQVGEALPGYLLGYSLVIWASAFLVLWRWQLTLAVSVIAIALVPAAFAVSGTPFATLDAMTTVFYLGTAALLACFGQAVRYHHAFQEYGARAALEHAQDRAALLVERLERVSREDALTGLANRRSWEESLHAACANAQRAGQPLAVILWDVDSFKRVNDHHGHAAGDEVLRKVAKRLQSRVRAGDLVARLGGDEFAVLCPDTDLEGASRLALDLLDPFELGKPCPPGLTVTVSVGLAVLDSQTATSDALMARADTQLYRAKETRNAVWAADQRLDKNRESTRVVRGDSQYLVGGGP